MEKFDFEKYKQMVRSYQKKDDPTGWFDSIYSRAKGDHTKVFWADLEPNPCLLEWMKNNPIESKKRAIAIGCGVGDDAEAMSKNGYDVVAFDISPSAIELCKKRYPDTKVNYLVADLFDYPSNWRASFDLVYECNTIQVLPNKYRVLARDAMVSLLAKGAYILVSCRSRERGKDLDAIPLPLDKDEIDGFSKSGLIEKSFLAYDDSQTPQVPHFFTTFKKGED